MSRQHDKWNRSKRPSRVNVYEGRGGEGRREGMERGGRGEAQLETLRSLSR